VSQQIVLVTLVVRDYDEAIAWFTGVLSFELLEDTDLGGGKRWVRVAPRGGRGPALLLARAANDTQGTRIGDQTGGRVFLFLDTDDLAGDYERLVARGVRFEAPPRGEPYGSVAVFRDLHGNRWDLVERRGSVPSGGGERPSTRPNRAR
jgi:catechol 2,3-dioxygenase-like lactoylglutathione lyase family enzyme